MLNGNASGLDTLIQAIRSIPSPDPGALPQRSQKDVLVDRNRAVRDANSLYYKRLKDEFIDGKLFVGHKDAPGTYAFYTPGPHGPSFFYIGVSGTGQVQSFFVRERLRKHFLTFDYFVYARAFPDRLKEYEEDCYRFYAAGIYQSTKKTYDRQFKAFREAPFSHIAWIADEDLGIDAWASIETFLIVRYQPPANAAKLRGRPSALYEALYRSADECLHSQINALRGS